MSTTLTELENYKFQLKQVQEAISAAADGEDVSALKTLESDLEQLISLTEQVNTTTNSNNSEYHNDNHQKKTETEAMKEPDFSVGDIVEAKWSEDNRWYEARIEAVIPPKSFVVVFTGYGNSEMVKRENVRNSKRTEPATTAQTKSSAGQSTTGGKSRKQKLEEHKSKKEAEHAMKQNAWMEFKSKTKLSRAYPSTKSWQKPSNPTGTTTSSSASTIKKRPFHSGRPY